MTIRAQNLGVAYGSRTILEGVDLTLKPGTVTAILGPNGAGKTTLLRALAGLLGRHATHRGDVRLGEVSLARLSPAQRALRVAVLLTETPTPFAYSALEIVTLGRGATWQRPEDLQAAEAALARVGAQDLAHRPITQLSAGERQRVHLARVLNQTQGGALLLDEPTSHQDPKHAQQIVAVLRELAAGGTTVAAVVHDVNLAAQLARGADDQVVILRQGRLLAVGAAAEVLTPQTLVAAYDCPATVVRQDPLTVAFDR